MNTNGAHNGNGRIDWSSSYITEEWIQKARIYQVDHEEGKLTIGRQGHRDNGKRYDGIVFPYYWPGEPHKRNERLRRNVPDFEKLADGTTKEKNKYLSAPTWKNNVYFPPEIDPAWLTDFGIPIVIVEGEKKAIALRRYYFERNENVLIVCLPGVWNWRGTVESIRDSNGHKIADVKGTITDLQKITWRGRHVRILFDANAATNESVNAARRMLAKELIRMGGVVRLLDLPVEEGINGVDDFLGKHGPEALTTFFEEAEAGKNLNGVTAFPLTDLGNAERFIARFGNDFHWDTVGEKWYAWDGRRWIEDQHMQAEKRAQEVVRLIPIIEGVITDEGEDLLAYSRKCESRDKLGSLLTLARSQPGVPVLMTSFDSSPYLLNCENGTLDLLTGELRPHSRDDLLTKIVPVVYDADAKCPRWEKFLDQIFAGNRELIDFVWQAVGYTLINGNPSKVLFVCHGPTNTGKSTFQGVLRVLFGDYGQPADIQTFMGRVGPMVYNDLADLYGARLVTASENNETDRLNDGLIKMVTGNDPVTACRKYENPFKYVPGFKIWLGVNHKPLVNDGSGAVFNRVKLIPFEVQFMPGSPEREENLDKKLEAELPGILAWAVRGCHDYLENGFRIPEVVKAAVEEYQRESDVVGEFIDGECLLDEDFRVNASDLYEAFQQWCKGRGMRPMSGIYFGRKLTAKGFKVRHTRNGNERTGIGLRVKDVKDGEGSNSGILHGSNSYQSDRYG